MKVKKLIALLTATTLVVLPTATAFAQTDLNGVSVTSDATVDYVDPTGVIDIVVPTSGSMAFTLDPQNLAATQGVGTWNPSGGGTILPLSVLTVVNKSAVPVKTTATFSVTDNATTPTTLVDTDTNINDGTDKKMHLTVTPANAKTSVAAVAIPTAATPVFFGGGTPIIFAAADLAAAGVAAGDILGEAGAATATFGQYVCTDDAGSPKTYNQVEVPAIATQIDATTATTVTAYNAATGGLANTANAATVNGDGAHLVYVIDHAEYYVSKTGSTYSLEYRDGDTNTNYDTASYIIGGTINKNANWSVYTGTTKIQLSAAYSFEAMTDADATTALTSKLTDSYNSVAYTAPVAPSIATTEYAVTATTAVPVTVALGAGASVATGITSITYTDSGTQTLATDKYTFSGTTLTFTSAYVDELIAANVTSREYTVTFNNTGATTVNVTLTYTAPITPVAPSIATTEYAVTASTAVPVTVDLGAGTSVATGITSITYSNSGTQTLAADKYTFSGTTLTFTSAYVDELIAANVTSRVYTVTFNNTAATTVDVTLTYTAPSATPSIAQATFPMTSATAIPITVSLGSGAEVATGITSITYVNGSGVTTTLATANYTFAGTTLTLTSTFVDVLIGANITNRVYTVTFNNASHTTDTITVTH